MQEHSGSLREDSEFRIREHSGFRIQGSGFRDSGFRIREDSGKGKGEREDSGGDRAPSNFERR